MITGTVHFDISRDQRENDRSALGQMYAIPAGVRVIFFVGERTFPTPDLVFHLREYVDTHHLDFHGSPAAVGAWVQALRNETMDIGRWSA